MAGDDEAAVNELRQLIAVGHEQRGVEFKGSFDRTDRKNFALVVRAVLGMANRRDGGKVIVGVTDDARGLTPKGLSVELLKTWTYDDVMSGLSAYTDPPVDLGLRLVEMDGAHFVILDVEELRDVPILCAKDFDPILRQGACYVRSGRKPETSEIPSHADMRDLLDLAIEKGVRRFMERAARAGLRPSSFDSDATTFDQQVQDLL